MTSQFSYYSFVSACGINLLYVEEEDYCDLNKELLEL